MVKTYFDNIISRIEEEHPNEPEFKNEARSVITSLSPVFEENNLLIYNATLEHIIEQDRMIDLVSPMSIHPLTSHTSQESSHGLVYFMKEMLLDKKIKLAGKTAIVSGSDSYSLHVMNKLKALGVKVLACSDEEGAIHDPYGLDLDLIAKIKSHSKTSLGLYLMTYPDAIYIKNPSALWHIPSDIAMACTLDTPISIEDAKKLVKVGCIALAEGAKLSTSNEIIDYLIGHQILFMPLKAVTVAKSFVESRMQTDSELENMMKEAFESCKLTASKYGYSNHLSFGANIIGFERVRQGLS